MIDNQGSDKEVARWVNVYSDELFSWALYKTSSKEIAEDLVQETFLSAYKYFDSYKKESNPKTWLFTILNNKIIDYYRSAAHKRMTTETSYLKDGEGQIFDEKGVWSESSVTDWEKEPHLLDNEDFIDVFQGCIQDLPEKWRAVTLSKFFHHKKGDQICKELEITPSNLWQIVHRSKIQLKKCLDKNWENDG